MKTTHLDIDEIQRELDQFLENTLVAQAIDNAITDLNEQLKAKDVKSASISITPKKLPGVKFPRTGQLIRVYASRPKHKGKVERHPNSFQTLITFDGNGSTHIVGSSNGFKSEVVMGRYWSFVPENVWHQPIAGDKQWVGVTFHSAPEEILIDEYKT